TPIYGVKRVEFLKLYFAVIVGGKCLKDAAFSIGPMFTSCSKGNASNNSTEMGELLKKYSTDGVKLTSLLTCAFNGVTTPPTGTFKVPLSSFCGANAEAPNFTCQLPAIAEADIPNNAIKAVCFNILNTPWKNNNSKNKILINNKHETN